MEAEQIQSEIKSHKPANTAKDYFYNLLFASIIIGLTVCIFNDPYFFHIDAEHSFSKIKKLASAIVFFLWSRPFAIFLVCAMLSGLKQAYFPSKNSKSEK